MDTSQSDLQAIRQMLSDLTARVYRIERRLQMDVPVAEVPKAAAPATVPSGPPAPSAEPSRQTAAPVPQPAVLRQTRAAEDQPNLESRIGSHWLNRIGIAAVLIGVSYFLKFAFDNNWIGPAGRVTIGILAGIAIVVWSERFRAKGYAVFSYSLKAVGIGTLYLSLWGAFQMYHLMPSGAAFAMMLAVTAATAIMALRQDAQILAAFALTGGFTTPLLLSTGQNREVALFSYVAILDVATLALVRLKPWRRLLLLSYAGTLILYLGWDFTFYSRSQLNVTLAFATLFFAIFAIAPLIALQPESEAAPFAAIPPIVAFVNAGVYFLQAYAMISEVNKFYMAWFALALALVYIALSRVHAQRAPRISEKLHFLHLAVAIGFITVGIPIRLDAHWITIGWFIESGVLLWVANRIKSDFLNVFALAALVMGVFRLLAFDNFSTTQLIFNFRMLTYAVAVAVLGAVAWFGSKREDDSARMVSAAAAVAVNVLALIGLSREVQDYFSRQMIAARPTFRPVRGQRWTLNYTDTHRLDIERDFTFSALWMAYGAMLMVMGFLRRSAFIRWQALILIAATTVKVFVYDLSELDKAYRILSFIALGVLLLVISFAYQRDWLQLSAKSRAQEKAEGSPTQ